MGWATCTMGGGPGAPGIESGECVYGGVWRLGEGWRGREGHPGPGWPFSPAKHGHARLVPIDRRPVRFHDAHRVGGVGVPGPPQEALAVLGRGKAWAKTDGRACTWPGRRPTQTTHRPSSSPRRSPGQGCGSRRRQRPGSWPRPQCPAGAAGLAMTAWFGCCGLGGQSALKTGKHPSKQTIPSKPTSHTPLGPP